MPFTLDYSQQVLLNVIKDDTEIGLLKGTSASDEIKASECTGYKRAPIGKINTSIQGQIANDEMIFIFECTGGEATATHFGLFNGNRMIFYGSLDSHLTISNNYVPLIRPENLIIGLDKDPLSVY